jgi:hypothetical protein
MELLHHGSRERAATAPVPSPLGAALPFVGMGLVAIVLGAANIAPAAAFSIAVGCTLFGAFRATLAVRDGSVARRRADQLLRSGLEPAARSPLLSWRAQELTSRRNRLTLARSFDGVVRELDGRTFPSAVPLNRAGARPHVELVRRLADRLRAVDRRVTPQGMLLVERLLTDGYGSPLYARERASDLPATLELCLDALEPSGRKG